MDMEDEIVDVPDETRGMGEDQLANLGTSKSTEQNNKDDNKSTTPSETNTNKGKSLQKLDLKPQISIKIKSGDSINRKSGVFIRNSKPCINILKKDSADNIPQDNRDAYLSSKISETILEKNTCHMNDSGDAIQMFPGLPSSSKNIQKRFKAGLNSKMGSKRGSKVNLTQITRKSLPRKSKNKAMRLMKELKNNKLLRNQHKIAKPPATKRNQMIVNYVSLSESDSDGMCPSCASDDGGPCSECGHTCCGNAMVE